MAQGRRPRGDASTIRAPAACPRFCGRVVKGIDPEATTPTWLAVIVLPVVAMLVFGLVAGSIGVFRLKKGLHA